MKIKSIEEFDFPTELETILKEEEFWEDESFEPITITIEEIQYKGLDMISYQADFEVLDEYEEIDGDEWEELIRIYIKENEPELPRCPNMRQNLPMRLDNGNWHPMGFGKRVANQNRRRQ